MSLSHFIQLPKLSVSFLFFGLEAFKGSPLTLPLSPRVRGMELRDIYATLESFESRVAGFDRFIQIFLGMS